MDIAGLVPVENDMYPYKLARLVSNDNDISKTWYVEYWVWDVNEKRLVRRRVKYGINRMSSLMQRMDFANRLIHSINQQLRNGAVVGKVAPTKKPIKKMMVLQAMDVMLFEKSRENLKPKTLENYGALKTNFELFARAKGYEKYLTQELTQEISKQFLDWLISFGSPVSHRGSV